MHDKMKKARVIPFLMVISYFIMCLPVYFIVKFEKFDNNLSTNNYFFSVDIPTIGFPRGLNHILECASRLCTNRYGDNCWVIIVPLEHLSSKVQLNEHWIITCRLHTNTSVSVDNFTWLIIRFLIKLHIFS